MPLFEIARTHPVSVLGRYYAERQARSKGLFKPTILSNLDHQGAGEGSRLIGTKSNQAISRRLSAFSSQSQDRAAYPGPSWNREADSLNRCLGEAKTATEGLRAGRVRRLGERGLDGRSPEVSEQDERTRRGIRLDYGLRHPDDLQHRAEAVRQENPGMGLVAQAPQARRQVRLSEPLGQPPVSLPAPGQQDPQAPSGLLGGTPAGGFHDAPVTAAHHPAAAPPDLPADLPGALVGRASFPRTTRSEDADGKSRSLVLSPWSLVVGPWCPD